MMAETMSSVALRSEDPIDTASRSTPCGKIVGWTKRSVPTITSTARNGGHGANAPLPTLRRCSALAADFLRKGVAQADGAVEHGLAGRGILVAHEIALPLELHHLAGIVGCDRRLDPGVGQDFQRLRIEVGGEIRSVRTGVREQLIVDADFPRHRLGGR